MKTLKILFLILMVLIVLTIVGIVIFVKTFDINKYKPELTANISEQLGRDVQLGTIALNFSLAKGISVDVNGITAAEDFAFGDEPFLTVDQARINLSILAYIEDKEILVTSVLLKHPQIRVIKNEQGVFNFDSLGKHPAKTSASSATASGSAGASSASLASSAKAAPPETKIENVVINGARILYVDHSQSPALDLDVSDIDLTVRDFALKQSFSFDLKAAVFSGRQDFTFDGKARVDPASGRVALDGARLSVDLSSLDLTKIPEGWFPPGVLDVRQKPEGKISMDITRVTAGPAGIKDLTADITARLQNFRLTSPSLRFENINLNLGLSGQDLDIREMSADFASGHIAVSGKVRDYLGAQNYELKITGDQFSIDEVLRQMKQDVPLAGVVTASFQLNGSGLADLKEALRGKGSIAVADGRLKDINVLRLVLSRISMLPNLVDDIEASLPSKYQDYLEKKDTEFEKTDIDVNIGDRAVKIPDIELVSEVFTLQGQAELDFDQNIKFTGTVFIPVDLSAAIVQQAQEMQGLLQDDGRIRIPLMPYEGPASSMKIMPDLGYLGKYLLINRGKQEIYKLLDKAMGRDQGQSEPSTQQAPSGSPSGRQQQQKSPEQQILEGVFDAILK